MKKEKKNKIKNRNLLSYLQKKERKVFSFYFFLWREPILRLFVCFYDPKTRNEKIPKKMCLFSLGFWFSNATHTSMISGREKVRESKYPERDEKNADLTRKKKWPNLSKTEFFFLFCYNFPGKLKTFSEKGKTSGYYIKVRIGCFLLKIFFLLLDQNPLFWVFFFL